MIDVVFRFSRLTDRTIWQQYTEDQLPVDIPETHSVYASCNAQNTGTETVSYTMKQWFIDPSGTKQGQDEYSGTIKPGFNVSVYCNPVTLNQTGYWKFHGELYINGSPWSTQEWTVLNCTPFAWPDPEGTTDFWGVYDVQSMETYRYKPVPLPVGIEVQGVASAQSTSHLDQYMKVTVWLIDPSGSVRGRYETGWNTIPGGHEYSVHTNAVVLDKPGNWQLHSELYAQIKKNGPGSGILVDSGQWHIIVAQQPPPQYPCPYCDQVFSSEAELQAHIASEHGEEPPPDEYTCPYCGQKFSTYEEWIAHIESEHAGEEPPDGTSDLLKWALIAGGIVLVSAFVIRPLTRRSR